MYMYRFNLLTRQQVCHPWPTFFHSVSDSAPYTSSAGFKAVIFFVLTLQATCYFSLLRYSRTRPNKMYFASTAVFLAEFLKLLVTLVVIFLQQGNVKEFGSFLVNSFLINPLDTLKLSVPSVLYIVQSNLVYIAMTHLESTTFQVCTLYVNFYNWLRCNCIIQCNSSHQSTWPPRSGHVNGVVQYTQTESNCLK